MLESTLIRIIADGAVVPIALIGVYVLLFHVPKGHRYEAYCRILMAGITAYLIAKLLGTVYQPAAERPFEAMGIDPGAAYLNNPGFPSDHALFVGAITLAVWFETRMKKITIILAVLVVLVCVGRVLALVHTPLDVIGGLLVSMTGIVWYIYGRRVTIPSKKASKVNV